MADNKPPAGDSSALKPPTDRPSAGLSRRDQFILHIAAAFVGSKPDATPHSAAKRVVDFADAFLAAIDKQ